MQLQIEDITIGDRHRKSLGNLEDLKQSIKQVGLLQPVVVRQNRTLIAGARRLEAVKQLGWVSVETVVAHTLTETVDFLRAERDENTCRAELLPSELVSVGRDIEQIERQEAETRKGMRQDINVQEIFLDVNSGQTRDKVGQALGVSGRTYEKAKQVMEAAETSPKRYGDLVEYMDQTNPSKALNKLTRRIQEAKNKRQAKRNPNAPTVTLASWEKWLPKQRQCKLLLTDPPYSTDVPNINQFAKAWLPVAIDKVKNDGRAYVFIGAYPQEIAAYIAAAKLCKIPLRQLLVWTYKNTMGPQTKTDYFLNYQIILYFVGPKAPPLDTDILLEKLACQDYPHPARTQDRYHQWQKPAALAEMLIRHSTKPGDLVLDPFTCSGQFPLSASKLGRVGKGCDNDRTNLDIAIKRGCLEQ